MFIISPLFWSVFGLFQTEAHAFNYSTSDIALAKANHIHPDGFSSIRYQPASIVLVPKYQIGAGVGITTPDFTWGFGGGAMIGAPLKKFLLDYFAKAPEYLGTENAINLITENGRRFAEVAGEKVEVVVATASEAAQLAIPGDAGVYVVGTGNT